MEENLRTTCNDHSDQTANRKPFTTTVTWEYSFTNKNYYCMGNEKAAWQKERNNLLSSSFVFGRDGFFLGGVVLTVTRNATYKQLVYYESFEPDEPQSMVSKPLDSVIWLQETWIAYLMVRL